jgi:hypothetical protein
VSEQGPQRMKNSEKFTKKIHIVTNSIVKINLSNLPKLSHFREIGEKFRKFNRNPSAFQVDIIHKFGYS